MGSDNDCFQGLTHRRYCLMLDRLQEALIAANDGERRGERWRGRPLFVTVPDAVADSRTTAHLWGVWATRCAVAGCRSRSSRRTAATGRT